MKSLHNWLSSVPGRTGGLALRLGCSQPFVSMMAAGKKAVPIRFMAQIESFTDGAVTRKEMCPDWRDIWPELASENMQKAASALSAKAQAAINSEKKVA